MTRGAGRWRTSLRTVAILAASCAVIAFAGGVVGVATSQSRSTAWTAPTLSVGHAGLSEQATRGSFCVQAPPVGGSGSGSCGDAGYPLPTRGRLPVRPGSRVILRPSVAPSHVEAHLMAPSRRLRVQRLAPRRWAVEMPARGFGSAVLDVSLRWSNPRDGRGDADFWSALREGCGR